MTDQDNGPGPALVEPGSLTGRMGLAFRRVAPPFDKGWTACRSNGRSFTLIELLVVIAIIALLVTLLVPALQEAKRMAKVVVCATGLRGYAMGLVVYGYKDESGKYPPHSNEGWGHNQKIWAASASIYTQIWPDKDEYLTMFRDTICGGNFMLLYCPMLSWRPGGPTSAGGGDPDYPLLVLYYDSYSTGYFRFANCVGLGYANSGNSVTDGPPTRPGSSQDALVCDIVESEPGLYIEAHMTPWSCSPEDAPASRRENSVGYGDGHVETHSQRPYLDSNGVHITWDGANYVMRGPVIRQVY